MTRPRRDDGPLYEGPASHHDVEDVKLPDNELPDDEACCADAWVAAANLCGCRGRR